MRRLIPPTASILESRISAVRSAEPTTEAILEAVVDSSPVGIYLVDLEGRVQLWNAAAERLFGWSAAEVIGLTDPTLTSYAAVQGTGSREDRDFMQGASDQIEIRLTATGEAIPVIVATAPIGGPEGRLLGTVVNILPTARQESGFPSHSPLASTPRSRPEEGRRTTTETARRYRDTRRGVRARERLLAVVSHDLRNSLATVLLNVTAIIDSPAAAKVERSIREQLQWIARSAEQMNRLIADLLDVSAIESGRLTLERSRQAPQELLNHTVEMYRLIAAEQKIALAVRFEEGLPDAWADAQRIQQVLGNLLGNAIKFSPEGTTIELAAAAESPRELRFSITDQGLGIEPEHLPDIFGLYWRRRLSRTGAGLGLAIAKGIVEGHGGRIWAISEVKVGSTFTFTVPAAPPSITTEPRTAE